MTVVEIQLLGRPYRLTAEPGQESHIRGLASLLDSRLGELKPKARYASDAELMMLAAITMAHDAANARTALATAQREAGFEPLAPEADSSAREAALAERERALQARLDELAQREAGLRAPGLDVLMDVEPLPPPAQPDADSPVPMGESVQIPLPGADPAPQAPPVSDRERAITLAALDHVTRRLEGLAQQLEALDAPLAAALADKAP